MCDTDSDANEEKDRWRQENEDGGYEDDEEQPCLFWGCCGNVAEG